MGNEFSIESNYRETEIRSGNPIGGFYKTPASIDNDVWHRLMPNGDNGQVVAKADDDYYNEKINITSVRSDIENAPFLGWLFRVLNAGYESVYGIKDYDSGVVHLYRLDDKNLEMDVHNIATPIKFVIYPTLILDFVLNYDEDASDDMEIGFQPRDVDSNTNIQSLGIVRPGESFRIPFQRIDRLFFKIASITSNAKNYFSWGEHSIEKR